MGLAYRDMLRTAHPVDVVEQIVHRHDWFFERIGEDEISLTIAGHLTEYHVSFSWMEDSEVLHISCSFSVHVLPLQRLEMVSLLSCINEKMLFGHFDYWQETGLVVYRQTLLLSGGLYPSDAQITMLLSTALDACELHFTAVQNVARNGVTAKEALCYAMFETVGNA